MEKERKGEKRGGRGKRKGKIRSLSRDIINKENERDRGMRRSEGKECTASRKKERYVIFDLSSA